jgi:hypothetical protein
MWSSIDTSHGAIMAIHLADKIIVYSRLLKDGKCRTLIVNRMYFRLMGKQLY